jgi:tripartite-type tricarboxylate transporter receptor subunit TctC
MKRFLQTAALAALLIATPLLATAQTYPTKPVRVITLTTVGGSLDLLARTIAQNLSEQMGQQFIVEAKLGAGGNVGATEIARAIPDGYTIGMITISTHGINPSLYAKMPFDSLNDFDFLAVGAVVKNVVVVNPKVPANNIRELVAYARANPGKLNFGSAGTGTSQHLAGEMFKLMTKTEMTHVPYKGAAAAIPDLVAGEIQLMFVSLTDALGQVQAGRIRAIAVTTLDRSPVLPDLPTVAEQGYPDYDVAAWFGMAAPRNLPKDVLTKLNREIYAALAKPDVKKRLADVGLDTQPPITPDQMREFVRKEIAKWAPVVKASGATAD